MRIGFGRWTAFLAAGFLLAACGGGDGKGAAPSTGTPAPVAAALPAGLILAAVPEGALAVGKAKASAKEGDTVVLRGEVGGSAAPFVPGRAVLTLGDIDALQHCGEMDMGKDGCKVPWDYCCEDPGKVLANTATIQVAGPDGRPLAGDLKGQGGIAELRVLVVKGVVGPRPDPKVFVVNATGIFVEPKK